MKCISDYVAADCGSTCYNNTGGNGCVPTDYGISICNQFYGGSDSCKFCVINNCGGYYGTVEIANKAFCKAKGQLPGITSYSSLEETYR